MDVPGTENYKFIENNSSSVSCCLWREDNSGLQERLCRGDDRHRGEEGGGPRQLERLQEETHLHGKEIILSFIVKIFQL